MNDNHNDNDRNAVAAVAAAVNGEGVDGEAVPPTNTTVTDSLSKELLKLSFNDRTEMEEEIHGVRCLAFTEELETPQLLCQALREFDEELHQLISLRKKKKQHEQRQRGLYYDNTTDEDDDVLRNIIQGATHSYDPTQQHPPRNYQADDTATANIGYCYVNDPEVRLRFLRCDLFDSKKAASRFVSFLEFSKALFGNFIAERPPRISDFKGPANGNQKGGSNKQKEGTVNEMRAMQNSRAQYLPFRDRAGRRIHCLVGKVGFDLDFVLRCKIVMYLHWIASEDLETQQKGIVVIAWPSDEDNTTNNNTTNNTTTTTTTNAVGNSNRRNGSSSSMENSRSSSRSSHNNNQGESTRDRGTTPSMTSDDDESNTTSSASTNYSLWEQYLRPQIKKRNTEIFKKNFNVALPLRVASIHFCAKNNQPIYKVLSSLYYFSLNSYHQSRYKTHFGENIEILYKLQNYGIPVDLLPITYSGTVKINAHSQWISFRTTVEIKEQQRRQRHRRELEQRQQNNSMMWGNYATTTTTTSAVYDKHILDHHNDEDGNNNTTRNSNTDEVILVECPRSYDICFRKGKSFKNNPGNLHFKSLIEETHNAHFAMNERKDKFEMTVQIADQIINQELIVCGGGGSSGPPHHHQPKMRFLEWNKKRNAWVLVNDRNAIRQKVANSFKEFKRSCTGRYNNTTNATATATITNSTSNSNSNTAASPSLLSSLSSWSASNNNNNNSNSNSNTNKKTVSRSSSATSTSKRNQRQQQQQQQQQHLFPQPNIFNNTHHQPQPQPQPQPQQQELLYDPYMFVQSKRQKLATPEITRSSSCFQEDHGSSSSNSSGNEWGY